MLNPLRPTAIQKLLEIIGESPFISFVLVRDRSRLGHKPDYRLGWSSEYVLTIDGRMPQCRSNCVQVSTRSAADAAKLGRFIGQFSWVNRRPIGLKGL